jgi:hypothetical protein
MEYVPGKCLRPQEIQLTKSRKKFQGSSAPAVTEARQWELQLSHLHLDQFLYFAEYQGGIRDWALLATSVSYKIA